MKTKFIRNTLFNIVLTVGIVVGVGIFFKNESIIQSAHGNTSLIISAWVIGGVISIASALAFSLLNIKSKNNDNNVAEFVSMAYGTRMGRLAKWSFMFLYYPIYLYVIAIFTTSKMFDLFGFTGTGYTYTLYLLLASTGIAATFIAITIFAPKISKITQFSTTAIKMIPFIMLAAVVIGAIFMPSNNAYWNGGRQTIMASIQASHAAQQTSGSSGIAIIFFIIPAVKFSFDGFISVTGNKRSSSIKSVSWGITIGMIIVTVIYILTTIAILNQGVTNVSDALVSFFGGDINNLSGGYLAMKKAIMAIIVISGLGSLNGFSIIWNKMAKQALDTKKVRSEGRIGLLLILAFTFSVVPWLLFSIATGDAIETFNVVSEIVLLLGFAVNALILAKVIYMVIKNKIKLSWVFILMSAIAILGITATAGYKIIDGLLIDLILHGAQNGYFGWPKWTYLILFSLVMAQFIVAPYVAEKVMNYVAIPNNAWDKITYPFRTTRSKLLRDQIK